MKTSAWTIAQGVILLSLLASNAWLLMRVGALETARDAAPVAAAQVAKRVPVQAKRIERPMLAAAPAAAPSNGANSPVDAAVVDDHLWSDEGRAAIDDVVTEREEREGERRAQRWIAMRDARNNQMIEKAADQLSLNDSDTDALRGIVEGYMERRGELWQQMKGEGEIDMPALLRKSDQDREDFDADLVELLGADDATLVQESFPKRGY
jgi:hypothetical protein